MWTRPKAKGFYWCENLDFLGTNRGWWGKAVVDHKMDLQVTQQIIWNCYLDHKQSRDYIHFEMKNLGSDVLDITVIFDMCCDLAGSVRSIDSEIQPEKEMYFFCFLLFWESFNCCNFGNTGPIQVAFSTKCTSPNEDFWSNRKLKMSYIRLLTNSPRSHHTFWNPVKPSHLKQFSMDDGNALDPYTHLGQSASLPYLHLIWLSSLSQHNSSTIYLNYSKCKQKKVITCRI